MIDLSSKKKIHIVGIGGISNSAIAEILKNRGHIVSGSDLHKSGITERMSDLGMTIYYSHDPSNIKDDLDAVVYTAAVSLSNPELVRAFELKIPIYSRAEMLGHIMSDYADSIGISGSHGKTTTTSMVAHIMNTEELDPTLLVGGIFHDIGSNVKIGKGDLFITEACEYKDSFLEFHPKTAIVLNIDEDHLDYFKDLDHIVRSFTRYAANLPENGHLILNYDDHSTMRIFGKTRAKEHTFSLSSPEADFYTDNLIFHKNGTSEFDIYHKGEFLAHTQLSVPGSHNVYNALSAFIAGFLHGLSPEFISNRLSNFVNADRRFQAKGVGAGITVIDDYAHHPSEIKATSDIIKQSQSSGKSIVVFQPHTYTRTKLFLEDFAKSLSLFDHVFLVDIYAAREDDPGDISSKDIADRINGAKFIGAKENAIEEVAKIAKSDDTVILMGAGDINQIAGAMLKRLS